LGNAESPRQTALEVAKAGAKVSEMQQGLQKKLQS
jgi:hypothetical protein